MKRIDKNILLIIGISLLSFSTVKEDPRKLICRRWKIEEQSIRPALNQRIKTVKKTDPARAQRMETNFESVVKISRTTVYEYLTDGIYQAQVQLNNEKATWRILEDNKTLIVKSDKIGEIRRTIVSLTMTKMVLKDEEAGAPEISYLPAE